VIFEAGICIASPLHKILLIPNQAPAMSKKRPSSPVQATASKKTQPRSSEAPADDSDSAGEFEDRWEDEYESEELVEHDEEDEDVEDAGQAVDQMDLDGEDAGPLPYLPQLGQGDKQLAEGEELVPDMSSYVMLHHARLAWPCLSFDVLRDVRFQFCSKVSFLTARTAGRVQPHETAAYGLRGGGDASGRDGSGRKRSCRDALGQLDPYQRRSRSVIMTGSFFGLIA
jgi:hypothetical protein